MRNSNFNTKELVGSLHRRALVGWDDEIQGLHQQWSHSDVVCYDKWWPGGRGANAENHQGKADEGWLRTTQDYPDSVSLCSRQHRHHCVMFSMSTGSQFQEQRRKITVPLRSSLWTHRAEDWAARIKGTSELRRSTLVSGKDTAEDIQGQRKSWR